MCLAWYYRVQRRVAEVCYHNHNNLELSFMLGWAGLLCTRQLQAEKSDENLQFSHRDALPTLC